MNYYISDPGDEQDGIFDYFTNHPSSAPTFSDSLDDDDWYEHTMFI